MWWCNRKHVISLAILLAGGAAMADRPFTEDFPIEECQFRAYGGNPYFSLSPGRQSYFSNQRCVASGDCDELEELWITVTAQTRTIRLTDDGVTLNIPTRVVQEFETAERRAGRDLPQLLCELLTRSRRLLLRRGGRHL